MRSKSLALLVILGLTGGFLGACEQPGEEPEVEIEEEPGGEIEVEEE